VAADATGESFEVRFMTFHDACSDEERQFIAWLFSFSPDALACGGGPEVEGFGGDLLTAPDQTPGMPGAFIQQYLQLQRSMHHENSSHTGVSNILRTRHDTVKNSISNVR